MGLSGSNISVDRCQDVVGDVFRVDEDHSQKRKRKRKRLAMKISCRSNNGRATTCNIIYP
jgi:hypothetical protein